MKAISGLEIQKKKSQSQQDIFFNKKIVSPQKLKILVLSGNDIVSQQLQFIHRCSNLLKLDLSNNHITKMSIKIGMENLTRLQILYLHHNKIENAVGLEGVFTLPKLVHLTIRDNPIERLPRIEHLIVNVIPTLKILGERVIFVEERSPDFLQTRNNAFIEPEISEGWKVKDNIESQYIKVLQLQLRYFDNVWVHNNPIVYIQRVWRKCLQYKRYKKLQLRKKQNKKLTSQQLTPQNSGMISYLKDYFQDWKLYTNNIKNAKSALKNTSTYPNDKTYLTLPLQHYSIALRNIRVQTYVKNYVQHIRKKIFIRKAAQRISKQLRRKVVQFQSSEAFFTLCHIQKTKKIYFNKAQTHLLENFLVHIGQNFQWSDKIKKCTKIGSITHYLSIRTVDPQSYSVKTMYSTLTYSMWPSMRAIFLKRKKFESKQKTSLLKIKPLYYIKNQNKILKKQDYKKSCRVYKQLQKFYKKQYQNSLDYFECQDDEIMKMLLRYIYYHNTKTYKFEKKLNKNDMQSLLENYQQPFLMYVESILERTAAAVRIQQNWRKYLVNKNAKQSIYAKMKKTRAVLRIQRFWRDHIFYHRLSFQKNIALSLKLFNLNQFLIPCQVYLKVIQLCKFGQEGELYNGLFLIKCMDRKLLKTIWNMVKPITSPIIVEKHFPNLTEGNSRTNLKWQSCDAWSVLHFNSKVAKVQYADQYFYQFKFQSLEQTKYRIYLLALLTYRCKGSTCFLPISKDGLDLISIRYGQYMNMKMMDSNPFKIVDEKKIRSKTSLKIKQERSFVNNNKITKIRNYRQSGVYVSNQQQQQLLRAKLTYSTSLEFYQKIYQDFPKKFTTEVFYSLSEDIQKQKAQEKQKEIEQLISDRIEDEQDKKEKFNERKTIKSNISERNNQKQLNVTKIDKKRLSLYEFGAKSSLRKNEDKPGTSGDLSLNQYAQDRRQNISRVKIEQSTRKQQSIQKRTANLKKIRDDLQKERSLNLTSKNMKQMQRTEQLKKKVQRIKQMKNRVMNAKKQQHQQDFVQQGNFVMEQQLKMVIMRNKIQSTQIKKKDKEKSETVSVSSKKNSEAFEKSFFTEEQNNKIKVFENATTKPIVQSLGATLEVNNPTQQTVEGEQRKIVNIRSQKRNKSRSIGAYLRDPSLVHGVFPEEYYPIQTKANTAFKFFPSLS